MRLRELQKNFQRHLLARDEAIIAAVLDAPPLPATERLRIYGNAYRGRMQDALDDMYGTLYQVLGDELFRELGAAFIDAHSSVHRSIRWYGRELPEFLRTHAPFSGQPILAELAGFEWLLSESFDAVDAPALGRDVLAQIEPAAWAELRLQFHPSVRRIALEWNSVAVWQAMSRDEPPPSPELGGAAVPWLLWRRDLKTFFRSLDEAENTALDAAIDGRSFGEMCAAMAHALPVDQIPLRAATLIGTWTDSGMVTGVTAGARTCGTTQAATQ